MITSLTRSFAAQRVMRIELACAPGVTANTGFAVCGTGPRSAVEPHRRGAPAWNERVVRALVGFSRFDAPDPEQPELIEMTKLSRAGTPGWVPASEVRGEGVFVRVEEDRLAAWDGVVASTP
jgi:hypothetical protein